MAEVWVKKPVNWTIKNIGAPLLDSLAGGLYSKLEVFREYVQNAVDSYVDFQRSTGLVPQNTVQVWVDSHNAALHIKDDGIGMDWDDINTAKSIAVSPKLARFNEFVGFRGLGIWSGLSACEQLVLTTTKVGIPYRYKLIIDCKGIVEHLQDPIPIDELLQDRVEIHESNWNADDHFTQVKLVNIYSDRFRELLDIGSMTRYAEQNLPVPFDPNWKSGPFDPDLSYTQIVNDALKEVPWTANYTLTINGIEVYRRFPPITEIKRPEYHVILDDADRQVAVAWLCETNRRGQKKVIEEKGGVRNFAIRVKNFTIGTRGLYTDQNVADPGNLDWFVGEIYITDTNIKPDTKRMHFQPSPRHDDVIQAIRKFYTSVALRARGWSAQVSVEEDCEQVKFQAAEIERLLADNTLDANKKAVLLKNPCEELTKLSKRLEDVREEANKADSEQEAERTIIIRRYLRKHEIKRTIDSALGTIVTANKHLDQFRADVQKSIVDSWTAEDNTVRPTIIFPVIASNKDKPSKARTNRLKGRPVSTNDALSTQAVAGTLLDLDQLSENRESKGNLVDLSTTLEAFQAAVAMVLGEETENYRRIMDLLSEELRRRGINV